MDISYKGITTNNVKNIDIIIKAGEITFFCGPSGSGKSSVAVDTIYKISEDELSQLFNTNNSVSNYEVKYYENILPAACLQQENYNRNPRSTIATYFSLDVYFKQLFSIKNSVSQSVFQFNTPSSACATCKGTGIIITPDILSIVDFSEKIKDIPFRPWRISRRDFYQKSLEIFCLENKIDINSQFNSIKQYQQELLLNGQSLEKYKIDFVSNGRKHTKTAKYCGPIKELVNELEGNKLPAHKRKYLGETPCHACSGTRFSTYSLTFRLYEKNIGDLYCMDIDQLLDWIKTNKERWQTSPSEARLFNNIERFLASLVSLNLGYLNLNRSIPSISGGELQRLRLAKAVNSQFTNFIYVLDEPTSGLHPSEWETIANVIIELKKKKNTIILIEHNEFLKKTADNIITMGPGGGRNGGEIVTKISEHNPPQHLQQRFIKSTSTLEITSASSNNINNLCCDIPLGTIVGICGVSGSGKTSFMRSILPRHLDATQYFSQTPIRGNSYSIVATALGVFDSISKLFATETNSPRENFFYASKGKGQCETCGGKGFLEEASSYILEPITCPDCCGRRFSETTLRKKFNGFNIYELLSLSIDDIKEIVAEKYKPLTTALTLASNVGLGYLTLFQNTSTLSGGEAQRVKFTAKMLESKRKQVFLLDEPFRGLDRKNIQGIIRVLYSLAEHGSSIFISEHNPFALSYCSYLIELGPGSGVHGGKITYLGEISNFLTRQDSTLAKLISQEIQTCQPNY